MTSARQKSQPQQYLKNLLGKHETKVQKVQNYLKLTQTSYEQKIKAGAFKIKQTSDIIHHKKLTKVQIQNMKNMRSSLQKNLKIIDSRIQELTEPDKKSSRIDDGERLKFVSQMIKARKQLQKKRQKKIEQTNSKQKQRKIKQLQQQKKKQIQAKQKRKEQILKRAQSLQAVRKNKKIQMQNQNKQLKAKMEQKILSERLADKFKQQEQSILQQRKKKLAEIRSIHKPLTKSQFQLHLQKIDKLKSQRSRAVDKSDMRYISQDTNKFYKSKWYNKTKEEQKQKAYENQIHEEELQQIKQMKDKLKKYSQYVRQNFKPQIDVKKAKQLSQKSKSAIHSPKTEDLRELGLKYLQWSKQHNDPNKKSQNDEQSNEEKKIKKPINYLQQLKKKHKTARAPQKFVQSLKKNKNLPQAQKAQKILEYVQAIQRKAKMREQKGKLNNVLVDEQLDNMYMEAIEMKLSMLGKD